MISRDKFAGIISLKRPKLHDSFGAVERGRFWSFKAKVFYTLLVGIILVVNFFIFLFGGVVSGILSNTWNDFNEILAEMNTENDPETKELEWFEFNVFELNKEFLAPVEISGIVDLVPPYKVVSSDRFTAGGQRIRLAYVRGLAGTDICFGEDNRKFPCGLMGRASLQNRMSTQKVRCVPTFYSPDDPRYACRLLDGTDLSVHQVRSGFARPDAFGRHSLKAEALIAEDEAAGAWKGKWTVVPLNDLQDYEN